MKAEVAVWGNGGGAGQALMLNGIRGLAIFAPNKVAVHGMVMAPREAGVEAVVVVGEGDGGTKTAVFPPKRHDNIAGCWILAKPILQKTRLRRRLRPGHPKLAVRGLADAGKKLGERNLWAN